MAHVPASCSLTVVCLDGQTEKIKVAWASGECPAHPQVVPVCLPDAGIAVEAGNDGSAGQ